MSCMFAICLLSLAGMGGGGVKTVPHCQLGYLSKQECFKFEKEDFGLDFLFLFLFFVGGGGVGGCVILFKTLELPLNSAHSEF